MNARRLHILLLLLLFALGTACTPSRGGGRGGSGDDDDDDATGDDDDATGDDDDATGDDDDATGDDDDATGDDDDATDPPDVPWSAISFTGGQLDFTGGGASGTWVITYWEDLDAQQVYCQQTLSWNGTANFGVGTVSDCANCTGLITVNPASVNDVSDPFDGGCDASELDTAESNYGTILGSTDLGGGGDFLSIATMDYDTADATNQALTANGGTTLADVADSYGQSNLELTHLGFLQASSTSFLLGVGFDTVAGGTGSGEDWYYFWAFGVDPNTNPQSGAGMTGTFFPSSIWVLQ